MLRMTFRKPGKPTVARWLPIAALSVLALLAAPALASATTQVSVQQVQGLDVAVAVDDESSGQIQTAFGIDETSQQHFVAVQSAGGATAGTGCQAVSATVVACLGDFDAIVVFGNGGNDTVTMDLIADGLPPLHGEAYGGAGNDTLKAPPDNRDVPQPETYIEGEGGDDTIVGGNGADELHGGDGNDDLDAWRGADLVHGEGATTPSRPDRRSPRRTWPMCSTAARASIRSRTRAATTTVGSTTTCPSRSTGSPTTASRARATT